MSDYGMEELLSKINTLNNQMEETEHKLKFETDEFAEADEALLDAALHEFAAHGFDGASTRAIATRAGVHQPQINYHFDSKEALWRAAVDHLFARLDALIHHADELCELCAIGRHAQQVFIK